MPVSSIKAISPRWVFYDLSESAGAIWAYKARAGPADGSPLNPIFEPMGPARIDHGYISDLQFNFKGHNFGMQDLFFPSNDVL